MKKIENALVILAGGKGSRLNNPIPKQFIQINGENLIHFFLKRMDINNFDIILIVHKNSYFNHIKKLKNDFPSIKFLFANSGKNRQLSSFNALPDWFAFSYNYLIKLLNSIIVWIAEQDIFLFQDITINTRILYFYRFPNHNILVQCLNILSSL